MSKTQHTIMLEPWMMPDLARMAATDPEYNDHKGRPSASAVLRRAVWEFFDRHPLPEED